VGVQPLDELRLARRPAVPRVRGGGFGVRRRGTGRSGAEALGAERRVDGSTAFGGGREGSGKLVARSHGRDPREACRLVAGHEHGALELLEALVARLHEERRLARPAVEQHQSARHFDAGQVEELVVLPERDVGGILGRALEHGDTVADGGQHLRAPRGEFLRREGVSEERRLPSTRGRGECGRNRHHRQNPSA
jgi:hypothetical protein